MIRQIDLENFKCFDTASFRTKALTIIAGSNGAGKSSVLQALLALRQSSLKKELLPQKLRLKGELVNLENAAAIRCFRTDEPAVKIEVDDNALSEPFSTTIADATIAESEPDCVLSENFSSAQHRSALFDEDFVYLYADRMAPEESYAKTSPGSMESRLGNRKGDKTLFRLQKAYDTNEELPLGKLRRADSNAVGANVNEWVSFIMGRPLKLNANSEGPTAVSLTFTPSNQDPVNALNMAFGHTYILPLVIGVLTAPAGSLMLIENPEAHLHPKAQMRMGEFLAAAADAGVQIMIETHSDHLLNGVRVAARKKLIDAGDVAIHYIDIDEDGDHVDCEIEMLADGALKGWPDGFFDEWEVALKELLD